MSYRKGDPMKTRVVLSAHLLLIAVALAQTPPPPRGTATRTVRGKEITVDYGRPSLKGRTLDALTSQLPPDRIWRAGMNQVTTLTTGLDLIVGGKPVPAGKYSLYVHAPATGDWSLILNKDLGIELVKIYPQAPEAVKNALWPRLDGYSKIEAQEVIRVPLKQATLSTPTGLCTISIDRGEGGGVLVLSWGDKSWSVAIKPA